MFIKLKKMYDEGKIDEKYLVQAIKIGWITEEEKNIIMGITQEVPEDVPTTVPEA